MDIDLDALLQKSIDLQVLAEAKQERVIQQHEVHAAAREQGLLEVHLYSLCNQLSCLSLARQANEADYFELLAEEDYSEVSTEVDNY